MKCPECNGKGILTCSVCNGTKVDPRTENKPCGYCSGEGLETCTVCMGKGEVPETHANL